MSENSPKTLSCPSCGAPLDFDGSSSIVLCKFCKTSAILPGVQAGRGMPPAGRWSKSAGWRSPVI